MTVRILYVIKLFLVASLLPFPAVSQAQMVVGDDRVATAAGRPVVESYDYTFPYKEMRGKSNHRVGDYARVNHSGGTTTTKVKGGNKYEASRKLRIEVVANDAATLQVDAKILQRGKIKDQSGLIDEALEGLLHTQFGVIHRFSRSATGTLSTSLAPDVVWQFEMDMQVAPMGPDGPIAQLMHGDRKIQFLWLSDAASGVDIVEVYEDGLWLSSGANRNYTFRHGLDPDLKLVLLGGMEAVKIAARFDDTLH